MMRLFSSASRRAFLYSVALRHVAKGADSADTGLSPVFEKAGIDCRTKNRAILSPEFPLEIPHTSPCAHFFHDRMVFFRKQRVWRPLKLKVSFKIALSPTGAWSAAEMLEQRLSACLNPPASHAALHGRNEKSGRINKKGGAAADPPLRIRTFGIKNLSNHHHQRE